VHVFEIAFRFRDYRLVLLFLAALVGGVALFLRLWPWLQRGRRLAAAVAGLFVAHLAVLVGWAATIRVDSDEVSHLHCAWLVSQGLAPFRDFWQDHSPALWYLLAPAVARFDSPAVLIFSRALASLLFLPLALAAGWLSWRVFRQRAAAVLAALILLAHAVLVEAAWLRPDQLANLLALVSLLLACSALGQGGESVQPATAGLHTQPAGGLQASPPTSFLAGLAFGVALSFTPKPIFAALAFPVALLVSPGLGWRGKLGHLLYYLLGGMAGMAPLLALLSRLGILWNWVYWVFLYHAPEGRVEAYFPAALALAAIFGCVAAFGATAFPAPSGTHEHAPAAARNPGAVLVAAAFLLQTAGGLLNPSRTPSSLMLWVALGAVLASPWIVGWLAPERPRVQLLAASVLILVEITALAPLVSRRVLGNFGSDRARMAWMKQQAGDRPVVLVTPVHTIFSRDATGLYELWQYSHHLLDPAVAASLSGFASKIVAARPALIAAAPRRITDDPDPGRQRPRLIDSLAYAGVLSPLDFQELQRFLAENYVLREVEGELFYVRK